MDLWSAARDGNIASLRELLEKHSPNELDSQCCTALHWAALNNRKLVCELLIEKGADVNSIGGETLSTALHWAAGHGNISVCELLISSGALIDLKNKQGCTALHVAVQNDNSHVCLYLLAAGADPNSIDEGGRSPLLWAVCNSKEAFSIRFLLNFGADCNIHDKTSASPLHWAVIKGKEEIAQLLIESGAELNQRDKENKTPADYSRERKKTWFERALFLKRTKLDRNLAELVVHLFGYTSFAAFFFLIEKYEWPQGIMLSSLFSCALYFSLYRFILPQYDPISTGFITSINQLLMIIPFSVYFLVLKDVFYMKVLFLTTSTLMLYFYLKAMKSDAGKIPRISLEKQRETIKKLAFEERLNSRNFCYSCFVEKPVRSKHCKYCNACICRFDHHCPYIHNCVGAANHKVFILYVFFTLLTGVQFTKRAIEFMSANAPEKFSGICLTSRRICQIYTKYRALSYLTLITGIFSFWVFFLLGFQVIQIAKDLTTNESHNIHRLEYFYEDLESGQRAFKHPFDVGVMGNFKKFLFS